MCPNTPFTCTLFLCLPLSWDPREHRLWAVPHWVILEGETEEKSVILFLSCNTWYFVHHRFFALAFIFLKFCLKNYYLSRVLCFWYLLKCHTLGEELRQNSVTFRILYIGLGSPVICYMHFDDMKIYLICWSVNLL